MHFDSNAGCAAALRPGLTAVNPTGSMQSQLGLFTIPSMRFQSHPPRFRLQFSLRMILALMAVIGVGLAVFRWPWVEESNHELPTYVYLRSNVWYQRRITYRRNWRAQPVKNGPQQTWYAGRLRHEAHYYEGELHGPRRLFNERGQVVIELHYRHGLRHGPYRAGDGKNWFWELNFQDDKLHGQCWTMCSASRALQPISQPNIDFYFDQEGNPGASGLLGEYSDIARPKNPIVVESNWNNSQRHGLTTYKTEAGEVLNTAEYIAGEFERWNGEPVVEQFRQWLLGPEVNDPQLAALLFAECELVTEGAQLPDLPLTITPKGQPTQAVLLHLEGFGSNPLEGGLEIAPVGPQLCERAVFHGYGFQYRYGGLWLAPRADPEPPFVDPTGVANIKFPAGSSQAREWAELIDLGLSPLPEISCMTRLFARTSIALEIQLRPQASPGSLRLGYLGEWWNASFRRSRRDALGYVLYRSGCRCELRSGGLVIAPRGTRSFEQIRFMPHISP